MFAETRYRCTETESPTSMIGSWSLWQGKHAGNRLAHEAKMPIPTYRTAARLCYAAAMALVARQPAPWFGLWSSSERANGPPITAAAASSRPGGRRS